MIRPRSCIAMLFRGISIFMRLMLLYNVCKVINF